MARMRTRMPKVFVGHPFSGRFPAKKFRKIFKELPFDVIYGNTDVQTKHLLKVMKGHINISDYSIFDLSNWNPNVALELGLAEGLRNQPGKNYYILLNTRRSAEVPSDIRGLQRLEYTSYDFKETSGLGDSLVENILSKEYLVKKIWKKIPDLDVKHEKKRILSLRILAHLRDHDTVNRDNIKSLLRGSRLRKDDSDEVLKVLKELKLIKTTSKKDVFLKRRIIYGA
jgi:hypothetical protein